MTKKIKKNCLYIIVALAVAFVMEEMIIHLTDNLMYATGDEGAQVVRGTVFNAFRFYLLSTAVFLVLVNRDTIKGSIGHFIRKFGVARSIICSVVLIAIAIGFLYLAICEKSFANHTAHYVKFFVVFFMAASLFVLYARRKIRRIETLFVAQVMLYILLCVSLFPLYPYGGDSEIHFRRSLEVARVYDENTWCNYYELVENTGGMSIQAITNRIEAADAEVIHSYIATKWNVFPKLRYIAYIPYAAGFVIADALNFSPHLAFLFSELLNAWVLCFVMYCGVKKLKEGKMLLIVFFTLPYIITTTSRFSYTPWVIIWITYSCAYTIGLVQEKRRTEMADLIKIYGSMLIGVLPKQPYLFMFLFPMVMLNWKSKASKEEAENRKNIPKWNLVLGTAFIIFVAADLILPIILGGDGLNAYSDTRGGARVSASGQLKFILTQPLLYMRYLATNIYSLLISDSFVYGKTGITSIGTGMGVGKAVISRDIIAVLFIWVIVTDKRIKDIKQRVLTTGRRIFVYLLTAIGIAIVCTVMYMNYSEVGVSVFSGINPMYLLTFMFPLFYYLSPVKIYTEYNYRIYNTACYGLWLLILYMTIFGRVVCNYVP